MRTTKPPVGIATLRRLIRAAEWVRKLEASPTDDELMSAWTRWSLDPRNLEAFEEMVAVWQGLSAPEAREYLDGVIKSVDTAKRVADVDVETVAVVQEFGRIRDKLLAGALVITLDPAAACEVLTEALVLILEMQAITAVEIKDPVQYCVRLVRNLAARFRRRTAGLGCAPPDDSWSEEVDERCDAVIDLLDQRQSISWEIWDEVVDTIECEWPNLGECPGVARLSPQTGKVEHKKGQTPKARGRVR